MGLRTLAKTIANSRPISTLLALVTTFAGVGLLIDRPKGIVVEWLALPLLAIGGAFFMWIFRGVQSGPHGFWVHRPRPHVHARAFLGSSDRRNYHSLLRDLFVRGFRVGVRCIRAHRV